MKRTSVAIAAAALCISMPVQALGIGDLAKVVLGGTSVLKKGEEKCGASLGLTRDDSLAMTLARSAVEQALPLSQLTSLDNEAKAEATAAATNPTFCPETKKEEIRVDESDQQGRQIDSQEKGAWRSRRLIVSQVSLVDRHCRLTNAARHLSKPARRADQ